MPYILGLTGAIASGKTTIGLLLMELGADVYCDADTVVHEMYLPGQPLVARLAEEFGPGILDTDGGVDRRVLGSIVFNDREKLRALERIVHPAVQEELIRRLRAVPEHGVGVLDAVKLVESGYAPLCHGVWLVTCPPELQIERRGLSRKEAEARLAAQTPIEPKLAVATEVIDNSGSFDDLRAKVTAAWDRFKIGIQAGG